MEDEKQKSEENYRCNTNHKNPRLRIVFAIGQQAFFGKRETDQPQFGKF